MPSKCGPIKSFYDKPNGKNHLLHSYRKGYSELDCRQGSNGTEHNQYPGYHAQSRSSNWSYPVSVDRSGLAAGATPQCFSSYPIGHS